MLWPCSCPCPTNKHVPHDQLINRISHLTWLILSINPAVTWYLISSNRLMPYIPT